MSFLFTGKSDPAPECFLATADTLVQTVMRKHRPVYREAAAEVTVEQTLDATAVA